MKELDIASFAKDIKPYVTRDHADNVIQSLEEVSVNFTGVYSDDS